MRLLQFCILWRATTFNVEQIPAQNGLLTITSNLLTRTDCTLGSCSLDPLLVSTSCRRLGNSNLQPQEGISKTWTGAYNGIMTGQYKHIQGESCKQPEPPEHHRVNIRCTGGFNYIIRRGYDISGEMLDLWHPWTYIAWTSKDWGPKTTWQLPFFMVQVPPAPRAGRDHHQQQLPFSVDTCIGKTGRRWVIKQSARRRLRHRRPNSLRSPHSKHRFWLGMLAELLVPLTICKSFVWRGLCMQWLRRRVC